MAKVLLIEDDEDLARTVVLYLTGEKHTIDAVHDGLEGLETMRTEVYDVVILDWDLPGLSGVEILQEYRGGGGLSSVIMLTGKGAIEHKEEGIDSGADDYLTKPFNLRELAARIRGLLRRPVVKTTSVLKVSNVELDPAGHRVTKGGVPVKMPPRDFALLEFFMRHPDEIFSVDALLDRAWPQEADVSPEGLRVAIRRIRKALGEDLDNGESIIENVMRVGYRLKSQAAD
jgi:two-component system OmpR family response regulator